MAKKHKLCNFTLTLESEALESRSKAQKTQIF